MADEQIIDVCPYQGECSVSGCKRNDDSCFVRQLFEERYKAENQIVELNKTIKAKEQECERLKLQLAHSCHDVLYKNSLACQLDQLKAENEEINEKLKEKFSEFMLKSSFTIAFQDNLLNKYKQTLTEIKEIAEKIDDSGGCAYGDYDCDNCSSLEQETVCTYKVKKLILQKISECDARL